MYPSLAVITVPKMPIITPKGDEIILRKKYNTNMNLLNEAFMQKQQLYNNENDIIEDYSPIDEKNYPSDNTPQTRKSKQTGSSSVKNTDQQAL